SYTTNKYTGPIQLRVVANPQKIKECIAKVREDINEWDSDKYFTDEQLATAKNQLAINEKYQEEQTSSYVHTIGFWWAAADIDYSLNYIDNVNKISRDDIKKYVRKYIKDQPSISGILMSPGMQQTLGIKSYDDLN